MSLCPSPHLWDGKLRNSTLQHWPEEMVGVVMTGEAGVVGGPPTDADLTFGCRLQSWQAVSTAESKGNGSSSTLLQNLAVRQQPGRFCSNPHAVPFSLSSKTPPKPFASFLELLLCCIIDIIGRESALSHIIAPVKSHC